MTAGPVPFGPADRDGLTPVAGGVCAPQGIRAGATAAGLKSSGRSDLALVAADGPVDAAAVTTTNLVKAAPCVVTERHVADGRAAAVVVNAGNANACTGPEGLEDAERTATEVAGLLDVAVSDVLVLSTGVIGVPMPMQRLTAGLPAVVADLSRDGGQRAAEAIRTTDTVTKQAAYEVTDATGTCRVGGMAKGAGMIEPTMATMLCVVTTDAPVAGALLRQLLRKAVAATFNRISIDACGSTNDTVVALATGRAATPPGLPSLQRGLEAVCADLARAIVADGEGVGRTARIELVGAASTGDAERLARAVAASTLVRAALHGGDPNWGRILAAMGLAGVAFEPARVSVSIGGVTVCRFGTATAFDRGQAAAAMQRAEVPITIDVGSGDAGATFLTAELTPEYVRFNAEYTT